MTQHRVVIIGSGFGGLTAAKALKHAPVDITLIARTQHHLFQGLLYQVATGVLSEGEIAPATRAVLRRQRNVDVMLGDVVDIDLENHTVTSELLGNTDTTGYDSLIVAAGANSSYFGNDHFADFAPGMKTIDDALEVRGRIIGALELAQRTTDPDEQRRLLTFTVVGAGPTGVELAGQIVELTTQTLKDEFRRINQADVRVVLLDALPTVLTAMGPKLGALAQRRLQHLGVDIQLGVKVVDVDRDGLTVADSDGTTRRIESACKVWSAGVSASPLGKKLADQCGATVDRAGRVEVRPDLTLPGHPNVFVIGDMALVPGVPGMAQGAIQEGRYAAKAITRRGQNNRAPFRYVDLGSMAMVSRFCAVVKIGRLEYGGLPGWVSWLGLHLSRMVGFKSKVTTIISWTATFLTSNRGQLTITEQQVYARTRAAVD
ncbi:NAD(P)/FAD-dependent oxidoreductase [Mycolicibacterium sp. BiH015]|uniref:NAD(P)/FAD-dependent oxidoreductase n=1 Tax=Mycolicibacterium sp. BiH015 TaxID=3018808 RepID=UPI0022DF6A34|nr:NAD(P)/FAD-dependent oxidoreductase [Mycolicibacterium sp. BiH015]MDA2893327.1 NAD(P)/FAD-dependent oxidoreductase [Mycolicibacterium sp. BiH015]